MLNVERYQLSEVAHVPYTDPNNPEGVTGMVNVDSHLVICLRWCSSRTVVHTIRGRDNVEC